MSTMRQVWLPAVRRTRRPVVVLTLALLAVCHWAVSAVHAPPCYRVTVPLIQDVSSEEPRVSMN